MSTWRILVRNLHGIGHAARLCDFDDFSIDAKVVRNGLYKAMALGLIESVHMAGRHVRYDLTALGHDYAEGRIRDVRGRMGDPLWVASKKTNARERHRLRAVAPCSMKTHFVATWLKALPRLNTATKNF